MTSVLAAIRGSLDPGCLMPKGTMTLVDERCQVGLSGMPKSRLVVSFEKDGSPLGRDETRCDFLFVGECPGCDGLVVPIEMKGGENADSGDFVSQLQAGARVAQQHIPCKFKVRFLPVLVAKGLKKADRMNAKRDNRKRTAKGKKGAGGHKMSFRGRKARVARIKCGDRLKAAFDVVRPIAA